MACVDGEVVVLRITPCPAGVEGVVVFACLLDLVELLETHAAVMRLRSFRPKCIIGADEEGIDLRHAIEDDVGAAAEEDSAVALVSDGTDDPALLNVELIVGRHAVKRCIAEITETVLADIVGAATERILPSGESAMRVTESMSRSFESGVIMVESAP